VPRVESEFTLPAEAADLRDEAVNLLRELLAVDTSNPPGRETAAAEVLARYLERNGIQCELVARDPARANLVARLRGTRGQPSLMLLGHTDVVPAESALWRHPAFAGVVDDDGYVWGRGALDMKNEVATRAVAMASLARSGEPLEGDLVFIAVADEEDGTNQVGMSWLVESRPDLATSYVLNEGAGERLALRDGRTVVTLSVGEKAATCARVTALGDPGHSSDPYDTQYAVPILAELVGRLARYRPRRRLLPSTRDTLEALLGADSRQVDDDLDAAIEQAAELHPALRGLLSPLFSTTIAPTRLHGSDALNVLPARASVDCDCRVLPGTNLDELREELVEALGNDLAYELDFIDPLVGGTISSLDSPLYEACARFVKTYDPGAIVLPVICTGFTDSHYARASFRSEAYGFWPMRRTPYEVWSRTVHGHDERVHADDLGYATLFHVEACRSLLGGGAPRVSHGQA
jgi:acetylornithine deacetylase/succinyl-diaminopimelate desuccinylase-like protein